MHTSHSLATTDWLSDDLWRISSPSFYKHRTI